MKVTKSYLKQIIMEELNTINERKDSFEMEMDLGVILANNLISVEVSESETNSQKIVVNRINVQEAIDFINDIAKEVPFEIDMGMMDADGRARFEKALAGKKDSAMRDYRAEKAAGSEPDKF